MSTKEIGGYFELGNLISQPFHRDCYEINCARNCLKLLVIYRNITKVYLPAYICDSIFKSLEDIHCEYETYQIDNEFKPIINFSICKNEYIYIVNYFGQLSNDYIYELKQKYQYIIVDNVQAFFQRPVLEVDTIYTCRKYFSVPDGAYLYSNININNSIPKDITYSRWEHILGRTEYEANIFYQKFLDNEKYFDTSSIRLMSKISSLILGAIDYEKVIKKRNDNFQYLKKNLDIYNELNLQVIDGAFMYPLLCKNNYLKDKLIQNKIYIPTLWPNTLEDYQLHDFTKNLIPIPCDQRYDYADLNKIIEIIKETFI